MPIGTLARSSIGKKAVMAVTGLALTGFVIGHLFGNLLVFLGPDALNAYAKKLKDAGLLLWSARAVLLGCLIAHSVTSIAVRRENRAARPIGYAAKQHAEATWAGRTMMLSGVALAAFILFHLLHFTFRVTHPSISHLTDAAGRHDVYAMVVLSFQQPALCVAYILAMALICLHLSHGMASWLQSLGIGTERTIPVAARASRLLALAIFLGYISIPVTILLGWIGR